jgi:hypothetical protein
MDGYWEEGFRVQGEWNDHDIVGRREALGSGKYHLMFRRESLEVMQHRGYFCCLNGMELGNDTRMTFFEHIFHVMGTNDLR